MRWARDPYELELIEEPMDGFRLADHSRGYQQIFQLDTDKRPHVAFGIRCFAHGEPCGSVVVVAAGSSPGVHDRSCLLLSDRVLVAIGNRLVALALPELGLLWHDIADDFTCFGLHVAPDQEHVVVHGELTMSKYTLTGVKRWQFSGKDVFSGTCVIRDGAVLVSDFNDEDYVIDLQTGEGHIISAG